MILYLFLIHVFQQEIHLHQTDIGRTASVPLLSAGFTIS